MLYQYTATKKKMPSTGSLNFQIFRRQNQSQWDLLRLNPGASAVLRENGLDPVDAAYLLANVVPRIITTEIKPPDASRGWFWVVLLV